MKVNLTGCALCDSTWGDYYKEIENSKLFFCCDVCASIFSDIVNRVKTAYDLTFIDYLEIQGNYKKRNVKVYSNGKEFFSEFSFLNGKIINFNDLTS